MGNRDARFRNNFFQVTPHRADSLYPVVNKENLPAALKLSYNRLPD
jgi:hypothetical protein